MNPATPSSIDGPASAQVRPKTRSVPASGRINPKQHPQERRLPGTVRAEDAIHLPDIHPQINMIHGREPTEALDQSDSFDRRHPTHHPPSPRTVIYY